MCGITGILNFDGAPVDPAVLQSMTDIIAHRGPDGEGFWRNEGIGLGHRRLSIIDLSHDADQPMVSDDGQVVLVFNGEIYNYRDLRKELSAGGESFRTNSDTEVILKLYQSSGIESVGKLRGMFAFAIWDGRLKKLFLVRDRVGIKPLYYHRSPRGIVFGSEIKAVVASGRTSMRVSKDALAGLMRFLVVPQPDTIFDDIKKLLPGRLLTISASGEMDETIYWEPPAGHNDDAAQSEHEWIQRLDNTLHDSVRYHMVADVPVSAFLSGGLDSSSVVALMRRVAPDQAIDAFSIGFPGQTDYDEEPYARKVAAASNIGFHVDTITENFVGDLETIAWHLDEPFAIYSAFATYYLARHAAKKTKVVLTGDGGDELFAGYEGYKNQRYLQTSPISGASAALYPPFFTLMKNMQSKNPALLQLLNGLRKRYGSEGLRYSQRAAQNSLATNSDAFSADFYYSSLEHWQHNLVAKYYDKAATQDHLQKKLYAEFRTRLVDEMLMKVDRMTMAHSLEARVPILDHEVVDLAFEIPSEYKLRETSKGLTTKYILKKAMEPYLPHDIIYRKKQGFNIPVPSWLQGQFLQRIGDSVLNGRLSDAGIIDPNGVKRLLNRQQKGNRRPTNMLMTLLVLETWMSAYENKFGAIRWQ